MIFSRLPSPLRRFAFYALCGGSGVALDFVTYVGLLSLGVWHHLANIAGYAAGTLLSFTLNRFITFRILDAPIRRLASFFAVAFVGYLCSSGVLLVLVDAMDVSAVIAKIVSITVVAVVQYSLNSYITFRQSAAPEARL